jgi:hypothetical protein
MAPGQLPILRPFLLGWTTMIDRVKKCQNDDSNEDMTCMRIACMIASYFFYCFLAFAFKQTTSAII